MSDSRIGWYLRGTSVIHVSKDGQTERAACGALGYWQYTGNTADAANPSPICKRCVKITEKTPVTVIIKAESTLACERCGADDHDTDSCTIASVPVTQCHYCPPANIQAADMEALLPDGFIAPMCGGIMCRELSDDDGAIMYDMIGGTEIRERQVRILNRVAECAECGREIFKPRSSHTAPWTHGTGRHRQTGCPGKYTYARPTDIRAAEMPLSNSMSDTGGALKVGSLVTVGSDWTSDGVALPGIVVDLGERDGDPISVEHGEGCAPLAYLPSMLTLTTERPWDDELVSGTETVLSILADLTDSDLCDAGLCDRDTCPGRQKIIPAPVPTATPWTARSGKRKINTVSRRHHYPKGK